MGDVPAGVGHPVYGGDGDGDVQIIRPRRRKGRATRDPVAPGVIVARCRPFGGIAAVPFGVECAEQVEVGDAHLEHGVIGFALRDAAKGVAHRVCCRWQADRSGIVERISRRGRGADLNGVDAGIEHLGMDRTGPGGRTVGTGQQRIVGAAGPRIADPVPWPRGAVAVPVAARIRTCDRAARAKRRRAAPPGERGFLSRGEAVRIDCAARSEGIDLHRVPLVVHARRAAAPDAGPGGAVGRIHQITVAQRGDVRSVGE